MTIKLDKVDHLVGLADRGEIIYTLTIECNSKDAIDKFIEDAQAFLLNKFKSTDKYLRIFVGSRLATFWDPSGLLPKRNPSTVILAKDAMKDLINDLDAFKNAEADYIHHGMPYKRVYCLYGPPGTGKTSALFALASHVGMNIAMMNIRNGENFDASMTRLVTTLPSKTFLVLEDVDAMFLNKRDEVNNGNDNIKNNKNNNNGLSTVLNVLDGNLRKHGMIVFMTTNHIEHLDPALIRPGRVDMMLKIDYLTDEQASRLYKVYFKDAQGAERIAELARTNKTMTGAYLNSLLFKHRKKKDAFWKEIESNK
jgi:chaperone BCS1